MDPKLPTAPINFDDTEDNINRLRKVAETKKMKEREENTNKEEEEVG